ncbi:hypothetical protein TOPH_06070 [Tolypocladium ophioglossoides CBS 100239]|uniref:Transcriptional regulator n=1 Tax=Tolypocladium ophioglossoides (strain CBS 100239) TaxID=1163406 RepID=A0A0L0N6D8_TOLOC|nr:hypothetical protein TOPH_06070 [Tolypocladium ophioglossoides CBS 100239]
MAPSTKKLEQALIDGTSEVFNAEPDGTSVNKVRRHVEEKLGLEEGFFTSGNWKQKSKALIKEYVDKLLDGWKPETEEPSSKNGIKRQSSEVESPQPKRRKRASKASKLVKKVESDASELEHKPNMKKGSGRGKPFVIDTDKFHSPSPDKKPKIKKDQGHGTLGIDVDKFNSPSPEQKPKRKKGAGRGKALEIDSDKVNSPSPDRKRRRNVKEEEEEESKDIGRSESGDEEAQVTRVKTRVDSSDEEKPSVKQQVDSGDDTKSSIKVEEAKPAINEEEEYSDVIDEPLQPKGKKKTTADKKGSTSKSSKADSKKAPVSATSSDDPNEAEIKKLQSHLVKCGVRKLWHMELKKYGDDARAKIRHLKKMLADVGMDGRFSEAKAREIRETRELMAETEAAQEMNRLWGMSSGGRVSRGKKGKTVKAEESEESGAGDVKDEDEDEDEDDGEGTTFAARRRRAQADLAFLGDDSDSD